MKKVVLITPGVLPVPATQGGAIETLVELLLEQNEICKNVKLIVFSKYEKDAYALSLKYNNSEITWLKSNKFVEKIYFLFYHALRKIFGYKLPYSNLYYLQAYRKIKKISYDSIVVEGGNYEFFKTLPTKENLYLHIHHELFPNEITDDIYDNIIGVSEFVKNQWVSNSKKKSLNSKAIYNCIREEYFSLEITVDERYEIRTKLGFKKNDFVILFCGRIAEVKGIKELLNAVQKCNNQNIKLLIIGSVNFALHDKSDFANEINELVSTMGERVKYTGYVDNKLLYKYYQAADIQAIPSLCEEAAGLVAIEGMYSGLPIIATNSGGLIEYIDDKCAIIVEKDDSVVNNIHIAIEKLYNNPTLRYEMSVHGKKRAKRFSKKTFYDEFIEFVLQ
ncbi:MAG: glycosyltransferase family 4 protein [Clostridia bacterium]